MAVNPSGFSRAQRVMAVRKPLGVQGLPKMHFCDPEGVLQGASVMKLHLQGAEIKF